MRPDSERLSDQIGDQLAGSRFLLIGFGDMARGYLTAARRLGCEVHVVAPSSQLSELAGQIDGGHPVMGPGEAGWVRAALSASGRLRPHGVLAFSEDHVAAAAMAQDFCKVPGPGLRAASIGRNKGLQRAAFERCGIAQPSYRLVAGGACDEDVEDRELPIVVKELTGYGSGGVEVVSSRGRLAEIAAASPPGTELLLEECVVGPEYSWEALVSEGDVVFENVTESETTGPPEHVELTQRVGDAPEGLRAAASRLGRRVVDSLDMRTGVVHMEFFATSPEPQPVEVAVRTPGDFILDLISLAHGLDVHERLVVGSLTGRIPPPASTTASGHALTRYFAGTPGVVREVRGVEEARQLPGVIHAGVRFDPGDVVGPLRSSADRLGYVVVSVESPEKAERLADEAIARIEVLVDERG